MKRFVALAAAVGFLAVASNAAAKNYTAYAGAPPNLKTVAVKVLGAKLVGAVGKLKPGVNAFFPGKLTIHVGDSVTWINNGEHTIDLPPKGGSDLPFAVTGASISGLKDAAGNAFWFNGLPSVMFNPMLATAFGGHTYTGTSRVDSGFYEGSGTPPPFKVTFTKPGTYKYYCDIHTNMTGVIVVVPKNKPAETAAQLNASILAQQLTAIKTIVSVYNTRKIVPVNTVSVGKSGLGGVELFDMFPSKLTVNAGQIVKFEISKNSKEAHTVTFGPTSAFLTALSNGLFVNYTDTQEGVYPSDDPANGPIPVSPNAHGNGFANIGLISNDRTVGPSSELVKFTTPGTYHYICLIHPFMIGTIVVK
ncbi:MAG TPA: hypothetical protein VEF89_15215 [Solirubrobacteraceae bacterium]|nr:hypothetical protein [Solirubrobacteraceae bacterium]